MNGPPIGPRLRVQDTQRILKICRGANDPAILKGGANVLTYAKFRRIAEPSLVVKLLSAAPRGTLVARVFEGTGTNVRGERMGKVERALAKDVARLIMEETEEHPFQVVNGAAAFLSEIEVKRSTPLFEARRELVGLVG